MRARIAIQALAFGALVSGCTGPAPVTTVHDGNYAGAYGPGVERVNAGDVRVDSYSYGRAEAGHRMVPKAQDIYVAPKGAHYSRAGHGTRRSYVQGHVGCYKGAPLLYRGSLYCPKS